MKRLKKLLSVILCLAFTFSATSCTLLDKIRGVEYVPEHPSGYTGGFSLEPHRREITEIHWVETYDEAMYIIEQLKSSGNEFSEVFISSYENEMIDAKYYFNLDISNTRRQKIGEEWYQRKFQRVGVGYCAFLDDISIEELEYSYYWCYRCFTIAIAPYINFDFYEMSRDLIFKCENDGIEESFLHGDDCTCLINNTETGVTLSGLYYYQIANHYDELPENFHDEFLKSLVVVGGK